MLFVEMCKLLPFDLNARHASLRAALFCSWDLSGLYSRQSISYAFTCAGRGRLSLGEVESGVQSLLKLSLDEVDLLDFPNIHSLLKSMLYLCNDSIACRYFVVFFSGCSYVIIFACCSCSFCFLSK